MTAATSSPIDDLLRRIRAEYTEMPGLRVTHEQAQRLWGLDAAMCRQVLDCLVAVRFLTVTVSGQYVRLTDGATNASALRSARLDDVATSLIRRDRRSG